MHYKWYGNDFGNKLFGKILKSGGSIVQFGLTSQLGLHKWVVGDGLGATTKNDPEIINLRGDDSHTMVARRLAWEFKHFSGT